jgi:outer membrane protein assembly factor BamB
MRKAIVLGVLLAAAALTAGAQADWPRWRGPDGNGVASDTGWNPQALRGGARVAWTATIGTGYSSPVISGGRLYAMGSPDLNHLLVSCLAAETGAVVWQRSLEFGPGNEDPMSTPATDGERVYGMVSNGTVFCLRAADGNLQWQTQLSPKGDVKTRLLSHGMGTSPVVDGGLVLVNANKAGVALDKLSGKAVWASSIVWGAAPYASPVTTQKDGKRITLLLGPVALNAVQTESGEVLWSAAHAEKQETVSDPVADGSLVFFSTHDACCVVDSASGEPRVLWSGVALRGGLATPVVIDGYLYGSDWDRPMTSLDDNRLRREEYPFRCVAMKTGEVAWTQPMKYQSLTASGNHLLMLDANGLLSIAAVSPAGLETLGSADVLAGAERRRLFLSPPVLCNGRIYCRNYAGDLVCIDVSAR